MKAARLFSYDKPLKVVDVDAPRIKSPTEVLVRVTGAGVCHTDLHIVEGVWREKVQVTLPYTLGHENAGIVQEVGDAVSSFKKGEKVIVHPVMTDGTCRPCRIGEDMHCENLTFPGITADGGFAEVLRTSERSLVRIHDLAPDDVAPLADAGLTAIRAVKKAASRTTSGSHIVVMGVGGLGHIALQLLRCMTNAVIIATDVVESKLRLAEKMGAHRVVDAPSNPVNAASLGRHRLRAVRQANLRQEHRRLARPRLELLSKGLRKHGLFPLRLPVVEEDEHRPEDRRGDRGPHDELTEGHEEEAEVLRMPHHRVDALGDEDRTPEEDNLLPALVNEDDADDHEG